MGTVPATSRCRHVPSCIIWVDPERKAFPVLVFGVICLLLGLLLGVSFLWTIGVIFGVIGGVLWIAGHTGHKVGGRVHYY
jgi:hypothetical protein